MARQALQASPIGIEQAKASLARLGWTQDYLAGGAGCTRQTVMRFFKTAPVERRLFIEICSLLGLDWEAVSNFHSKQKDDSEEVGINILIDELRKIIHTYIEKRCGSIRILDMEWPIKLEDIYTSVNRLEKISGRRRLDISELLRDNNPDNLDCFRLGKITQQLSALDAVETNTKLMVLGKPGAGKSTFLKHLALQCNRGQFRSALVPIFVNLKDFSETQNNQSLLEYISLFFSTYEEQQAIQSTEKLLIHGRALILLDGLDEVRYENSNFIIKQLRSFIDRFYSNHFIITCRLSDREYTFEDFAEVEIADFNNLQINGFIKKWFKTKGDLRKAEQMIEKLEDLQRVKELATSPLLLTLLCLIFEEGSDFQRNRSELYKEGLDILLKKWDAKRDIARHQIYKKLSLKRKEDLLGQLAFDTFNRGEYFFKQSTVERHITEYIRNIPGTGTDEEALQLDSEAVLRSIMAQHGLLLERAKGIFSFSHLTFHEYFAAKRIVDSSITQGNKEFLRLGKNVTNRRWREVFFLVVEMLPDASSCLLTIKQEIDKLLAGDEKLQKYLVWLDEKSKSINDEASISVYYSYLHFDQAISFPLEFFLKPFPCKSSSFKFDYLLTSCYCNSISISKSNIMSISYVLFSLDQAIQESEQLNISTRLIDELKNIKQHFDAISIKESDPQKWKDEIYSWQQNLRAVMIQHRNIGHDWQFTKQQNQNLRKYYFANELLKDCLESECYVDLDTRKYITDTFCRPFHLIPPRA
jgi:predicted NACHT family NTPase